MSSKCYQGDVADRVIRYLMKQGWSQVDAESRWAEYKDKSSEA